MKAKISNFVIIEPIILLTIVNIIFNNVEFEFYEVNTLLGIFDLVCLLCCVYGIIFKLSNKLYCDDKKIYGRIGVFNITSLESPINKINDIQVNQNLFARLFNFGTITINSSSSKYVFKYIISPISFRRYIMKKIDKQ